MARERLELAREKALYRYSTALERGDLETVAQALEQAENDPVLESMILELNQALLADLEAQPEPVAALRQVPPDGRSRGLWARLLARIRPGPAGRPSLLTNGLALGGAVLGMLVLFAIGLVLYASLGGSAGGQDGRFASIRIPSLQTANSGTDRGLREMPPAQPPSAPAPTEAPALEADYASASDAHAYTAPADRMIIRNGSISLVVKDTRSARQAVESLVAEMAGEGAFVISSNEQGGTNQDLPYITMSIRVPASRFDEVMGRLAGLAVRVASRNDTAQDVTEEYVDLQARLESLKAARQRLQEIMQSASSTKDLLEAEQQLTQREAEIESLEGRQQYLTQSAQLASIQIELQPSVLSQPVGNQWRPAEAARRAVDSLANSLRSLADGLIFLAIAVLPWLVVAGLIVYLIVRLIRAQVRRT
jgi:hypothetical protein